MKKKKVGLRMDIDVINIIDKLAEKESLKKIEIIEKAIKYYNNGGVNNDNNKKQLLS